MVCFKLFGKKLKKASGIYGNPIEIPIITNNQFRVLRSLTLGGHGLFCLWQKAKDRVWNMWGFH